MATTYRDLLREIAVDNHGYVTTADAVDAGVPAVELPKLAARGGLEHVGYGLYRMTGVPPTDDDQFAEATLRAGSDAYLRGEAVLALLGLADVNPSKITVGTTRRVRRSFPSYIDLVYSPIEAMIIRYHGIRAQQLSEALLECRGRVPETQLRDAAAKARADGLLTTAEWKHVRKELAA
ncbi:type IV toxin-antitoxin system AbiEi family antitoxin domain-containing protein [Herbiconiux liangxiaofengii]|uniref:type IV toxin-antitoxin system AbiEi family antitoxin domain-containing protein n=1 Tax=Herbiconiux liangxiaofengii TaxID=3342795 RepID=UPI0035B7E978